MKVTVQYYDKKPEKAKAAVAKAAGDLKIEDAGEGYQTIEVENTAAAAALIKKMHDPPIANVQVQTEA